MDMKEKNWKTLLLCLLIPPAAGGLGALLAGGFGESYGAMYKPLLSPPGWVFPIVWTILYVLMGVACWQVWQSEASPPRKKRALTLYGVQLAMNALWPLFFFRMSAYLAAFIWLILLLAAAWLCALTFRYIRKSAGDLSLSEALDTDGEGSGLNLMDVVSSDEDLADQIGGKELCESLRVCVERCLDEREGRIIRLRYGLDGRKPLTQLETAGRLGISRSYVSRLEKRALEKLRAAIEEPAAKAQVGEQTRQKT